jgi:hypothetical protein
MIGTLRIGTGFRASSPYHSVFNPAAYVHGYLLRGTPSAVEAFQLALPALAPIERLIVSAQKRLNVFLDGLERTSKANARALRLAAEKTIAEHDAALLAWRK